MTRIDKLLMSILVYFSFLRGMIKLREIVNDEQEWKEMIERKLDDINDKLNKLLLFQRPLPSETPSSPWYTANKTYPWFDTSKVYCDNDLKNYKYVYTSNIAPEETHNYKERYE